MSSPHVRQRRLSDEITRLMQENGSTADRLASSTGLSKQRISRIIRCRARPNVGEILRILDHFAVDPERRRTIVEITRDAQERGWWERHAAEMGMRQALYADLEWGAATICEYQLTFVPGLLQTELFSRARMTADRDIYRSAFDADSAVEARQIRQRILQQPGGPVYEVVVDELAIRRPAAPAQVVAGQLDHLVEIGHHREGVSIRVLPTSAVIEGHAVPRSSFSVYRYPDPGDPTVVAVDTATSDLVIFGSDEVASYLALYGRLRAAALSPSDSLDFLAGMAEEFLHDDHTEVSNNYAHQVQ